MSGRQIILLGILFFFSFCNRKKDKQPLVQVPPLPSPVSVSPPCEFLPPPPAGFNYHDSTTDPLENIEAFIINPLNADEILCMLQGDLTGYHQLYTINVVTKKKIHHGNCGNFLPDVSKQGRVIWSSPDNNIYSVKLNGDSLLQHVGNKACHGPKWSTNGKEIWYFQEAVLGGVAATLSRIRYPDNSTLYVYPNDLPQMAVFNKSNKILFLRNSGSLVTVMLRDMHEQTERPLISGPFDIKTSAVHFNNLCVDKNDQNFFWFNEYGIFRCNLTSLKVDTLLKNCPVNTYLNPIVSFEGNELNYCQHTKTVINKTVLLHQYKAMQLDLNAMKTKEIRIFPGS